MNKPLIIKCNRMLSPEELEGFRKKWNSQMAANEVVVLPYGFELAEANVELLENIKAEMLKKVWRDAQGQIVTRDGFNHGIITATDIIDKHIAELKGETE